MSAQHTDAIDGIDGITDAISNFLLPNSKEKLRLLATKTSDELHTLKIMSVFPSADLESLQFIVKEKLLHPDTLCAILARTFGSYGTRSRPIRKIYEYKLQGRDYEKEMQAIDADDRVDARGDKTYSGWLDLAEINADFLVDYLCKEHPESVAAYRYRDPTNDDAGGTLLHHVFYGHARFAAGFWIRRLLDVGCDPFAPYGNGSHQTPFLLMLNNLFYDFAVEMMSRPDAPNFAVLINHIDAHERSMTNRNAIQKFLLHFRFMKNVRRLPDVRDVINLIVRLGVDMDHRDKNGMNVTDYIEQYGYSNLLADDLSNYKLPKPTGNKPVVAKLHRNKKRDQKHNPSPYADLFFKHRHAKHLGERSELCNKYMELKASHGPLTNEQLADTGRSQGVEYEALSEMIYRWNINYVIHELSHPLQYMVY